MNEQTKHLVNLCAIQNDDCREAISVNWLWITLKNFHTPARGHIFFKMPVKDYQKFNICENFSLALSQKVIQSKNLCGILSGVKHFKNFSSDNDPYGEHDFGNFKLNPNDYGHWYFKFDYFENEKMGSGAENHLINAYRRLTIYHSSEH